jgi:hypothetical protein
VVHNVFHNVDSQAFYKCGHIYAQSWNLWLIVQNLLLSEQLVDSQAFYQAFASSLHTFTLKLSEHQIIFYLYVVVTSCLYFHIIAYLSSGQLFVPPVQGVTKRCRLTWRTNSALVCEPICGNGGGGGLAPSQPMSSAVHIT